MRTMNSKAENDGELKKIYKLLSIYRYIKLYIEINLLENIGHFKKWLSINNIKTKYTDILSLV